MGTGTFGTSGSNVIGDLTGGTSFGSVTPGLTGDLTGVAGSGGGGGPIGGLSTGEQIGNAATLPYDVGSGGSYAAGGGDILSNLTGAITKNPLQAAGLALGAGGLGYSLLNANKQPQSVQDLSGLAAGDKAQAAGFIQQGQTLQNYQTQGTLPAGQQAQLDQAVQAEKARIVQNHASQGLPADPTKNSALAQELNAVDERALATKGTLEKQLFDSGQQLVNAGIQESGMAAQLYAKLQQIDASNTTAIGTAIANFAKQLSGGTLKAA
jgi:hypothetical protein